MFKAYGHLSDHIKRHLNLKPFECEICKNTFSRKNTLKTHLMTHTGEKPFGCTFPNCNRKFLEKGNMKTHFKTHMESSKKKLKIYKFLTKIWECHRIRTKKSITSKANKKNFN